MKHSADSPPTQDWAPVGSRHGAHEGRRGAPGPSGARGIPSEPARPWWELAAGPAIVIVLLIVGALVGASLGRMSAAPASSSSPSPSPSFALEPPVQVGDLVRGEITESEGPAPDNQRIVRADYSDGANRMIFVMTWPVTDASAFVSDAGVEGIVDSGGGTLCGTSIDTSLPACGRVLDGTGLLLLAVTEQATSDVAALLTDFEAAVVGDS